MDINDRIKEVRIQSGLTQTAFAEKCGLGRDVISNIELHRNTVTKLYIKLVVDNFGVSEEWLRDGSGEMFLETKDQFIDKLAGQYGLDEFMKKVISAYSELSDSEKDVIKSFIAKIAPPADPQQREWLRSPTINAKPFPVGETEQVKDFARDQDDSGPFCRKVSKEEIEAALKDDSIKSDDDL